MALITQIKHTYELLYFKSIDNHADMVHYVLRSGEVFLVGNAVLHACRPNLGFVIFYCLLTCISVRH